VVRGFKSGVGEISMSRDKDFDKYCQRYLEQWEQRATVRHLTRTRLTAETSRDDLYPPALQISLSHPEVVARGPEVRHRLLALQTASFMTHVALLEVDIITNLCIDFVGKGAGIPVPYSAQQVALTVATDELYHAFVAREFIADLKEHTGIEFLNPAASSLQLAFEALRSITPAELTRPTEIMALCFAENFVTEELFGLSKEAEPQGAFHTNVREHMMDEGRHQIFFQKLFRYLWHSLDEDQRRALGQLIPCFLDGFLDGNSFEKSEIDLLEAIGFDHHSATRIAKEAIAASFSGQSFKGKSNIKFMRNVLNLVDVSGILEHAPTRQVMTDCGWVEA